MPDTKITALAAITTVAPANDLFAIVDVSDNSMAASGTTKNITTNQILGAGGTATLASATISGDLTVDTSTLKVDSTNNRVGIVNASPTVPLDVVGTIRSKNVAGDVGGLRIWSDSSGDGNIYEYFNGSLKFGVNDTLAMTLNTTGLGVGVASPAAKLDVLGNAALTGTSGFKYLYFNLATDTNSVRGAKIGKNYDSPYELNIHATTSASGLSNEAAIKFYRNLTDVSMTLDSSGNVGIGVTPSASWVTYKALEFDTGIVSGSSSVALNRNCYFDGVNWRYKVTTSFGIAQYQLSGNGNHIWNIASSGSVGAAINGGTGAWTQAMTLDASGYLLIATTDTGFTSGAGYKFGPGATPSNGQVGASSSNGDLTLRVYSTGAAAYRFYVGYGGTVFATNTTISAISDARFKENVQDIDVGLGAILALKPRKFDWKAGKGKDIKGDRGFIAQEFEQVFPQLVDEWADPAPEGEAPYKSVRQDLIPVLVKAIQELAAEVNALKNA
jgi:hypothetical protein